MVEQTATGKCSANNDKHEEKPSIGNREYRSMDEYRRAFYGNVDDEQPGSVEASFRRTPWQRAWI